MGITGRQAHHGPLAKEGYYGDANVALGDQGVPDAIRLIEAPRRQRFGAAPDQVLDRPIIYARRGAGRNPLEPGLGIVAEKAEESGRRDQAALGRRAFAFRRRRVQRRGLLVAFRFLPGQCSENR